MAIGRMEMRVIERERDREGGGRESTREKQGKRAK